MEFYNSYEDEKRAAAYAKLEFAGTYYLAFRDIPEIIRKYVTGKNALDFGCGTGRSTRFLKNLGFQIIGIDISDEMITLARTSDPSGKYILINDGDFSQVKNIQYDLILSAFTFDNIPKISKKTNLFTGLKNLLHKDGIFINLVSTPDMYTHEWTSFSTKDYPENMHAKTGDIVPIITKDIDDKRPCYDVFFTDEDYKSVYKKSELDLIDTYKPIATGKEPYRWINETRIAPWILYILKRK